MKWTLLILGAAAILVAAVFLRRHLIAQAALAQPFDSQMSDVAAWAVEVARTDHNESLDYTRQSIAAVERILATLHERHAACRLDEAAANKAAFRWGAYVGEVAKRLRPGAHWERDSAQLGPDAMPLILRPEHECYPCGWCWRRITNGPEDNIEFKFLVSIDRDGEPPEGGISVEPTGR